MAENMTDTRTPSGSTESRVVDEGLGGARYKEYEYPPYAQVVSVRIPLEVWSGVVYSWLSLKGHMQGLHGFDRSEFFTTAVDDTHIYAIFVVVWQGADTLAEWMQRGYSTEKMLAEMGIPSDDIDVHLMRDYS